jgi:hypothetical protein
MQQNLISFASAYFQYFEKSLQIEEKHSVKIILSMNPDHLYRQLLLGQGYVIDHYVGKISMNTIKTLKKLTKHFYEILKDFLKKPWIEYQKSLKHQPFIPNEIKQDKLQRLHQLFIGNLSACCHVIYPLFEKTMFPILEWDFIQSVHEPFPSRPILIEKYHTSIEKYHTLMSIGLFLIVFLIFLFGYHAIFNQSEQSAKQIINIDQKLNEIHKIKQETDRLKIRQP